MGDGWVAHLILSSNLVAFRNYRLGVRIPVDSRLVVPKPAWWRLSTNREHSNRILLRRFSGYNPCTMFTVHLFYLIAIPTRNWISII